MQRKSKPAENAFTGQVKQRPLGIESSDPIREVVVNAAGLHPLIYAKRVEFADRRIEPGELVAVRHREGNPIGYGIFNPKSEIRVRMLCTGDELPDDAFWNRLLDRAVSLRRDLLRLDEVCDAYRVVHAESDGLSGLMVDRYGDVLSAEAFGLGMMQRVEPILDRLAERLGTKHRIARCGPQTLAHEGFAIDATMSPDCPSSVVVSEYGTRFRVRFEGGHKTGFFCDQRENRKRLAEFCKGKSVLDICCYTGGFAVQAKRLGQAEHVVAVDLDEVPLEQARENANLNQVRIECVHADAFSYMRDIGRNGRQFDVVVLDPPKLIRSRAEIEEGTTRHYDLNRLAFALVAPGGLLLTCSCAGLLGLDEFTRLIHSAARKAGREIKILATTGAASDHPITPACMETSYLKAVWLRVE